MVQRGHTHDSEDSLEEVEETKNSKVRSFSLQVIASGETIVITGNSVDIVQRYKKLWELHNEDHLHLLSMKVNWEVMIPTS